MLTQMKEKQWQDALYECLMPMNVLNLNFELYETMAEYIKDVMQSPIDIGRGLHWFH